MSELNNTTNGERTRYNKNVERIALIAVAAIIVLVVFLTMFLTNLLLKRSTEKSIVNNKPKTTDIVKIHDLKTVNSYDESNTIDNFDYIKLGKYKGVDLEWLVLSAKDGEALVISKYVIKSIQYAEQDKKGLLDNWWLISNVRDWLNRDFYNETFTDSEKDIIIEKGGNPLPPMNHPEKVTILDDGQIKKYFGEKDKKVISNHTKTKLLPGLSDEAIDLENGYVPYWTKTDHKDKISAVKSSGELGSDGYPPTYQKIGVRPAIYIKY